jgi:drug/metabolite transporter (DMT)-like permease
MDVVLLSLASAFFIALGHVLAQFGLRSLAPLTGAGISVPTTAIAFVLLSPLFLGTSGWNWTSLLIFASVGCVFPAVVTLMNFESNRRVGPGLTAALTNFTPVFAIIGGLIVLGEAPRPIQAVALAVILAGVALMLWKPERFLGSLPVWALALPIAGGALRGLTQAGIKFGQISWPDPYAATTISYIASALVILTVKAAAEREIRPPAVERGTLWFMATGISNGLSVLTLYAALARGPIAVVAPLVACYPLFAVALARVTLGASIDARTMMGIAITVAGLAILIQG